MGGDWDGKGGIDPPIWGASVLKQYMYGNLIACIVNLAYFKSKENEADVLWQNTHLQGIKEERGR